MYTNLAQVLTSIWNSDLDKLLQISNKWTKITWAENNMNKFKTPLIQWIQSTDQTVIVILWMKNFWKVLVDLIQGQLV